MYPRKRLLDEAGVSYRNFCLEALDRVFIAFFRERLLKSPHEGPELAWHRATFAVSLYLVFPFSAIVIFLAAALTAVTGSELVLLDKRPWMIGGALVYLVIGITLDRRFKKLLAFPTGLDSVIRRDDHQIRMKFRLITIGIFVAVCTTGYLMNIADRS